MIRSIIQELKPNLLELKFIERYGGVVIPITQIVETEDRRQELTFPISCDIEGKACFEDGNYFELAPNDQYRSVAYWEVDRALSRQTPRRGSRYWQYSQDARFVAWLNLANLGVEAPCDLITNLIIRTINEVEKGVDQVEDTPIENVRIRLIGQEAKSMDIFRRYSYRDRVGMLLYPFDFFALDFNFTWLIRKDCVFEENEYIAIDCISQ